MAIDINTLAAVAGSIGTPVFALVKTPEGLKLVELGEFAALDMPLANVSYVAGDSYLMRRGTSLVSLPYVKPEPFLEQISISNPTRTLATSDDRKSIRMTGASAAITIPAQSTAAFAAGFTCGGSMTAGGTITAAAGVTLNGVSGGSVAVGPEADAQRFRLERAAENVWLVSGPSTPITSAGVISSALVTGSADAVLAPQIGMAVSAAIASLSVAQRRTLLTGLFAGIVNAGEVVGRDDGGVFEGLPLMSGIEATQADVLAGADLDRIVTPKAAGGFFALHVFPSASTFTMDFTGSTPAWGARNRVGIAGSATIKASVFPSYMVGQEFWIECVRESGTGGITLTSDGASVEYRSGSTAADMPTLGATVGDGVTICGRVMSATLWRVEAFEYRTA